MPPRYDPKSKFEKCVQGTRHRELPDVYHDVNPWAPRKFQRKLPVCCRACAGPMTLYDLQATAQ